MKKSMKFKVILVEFINSILVLGLIVSANPSILRAQNSVLNNAAPNWESQYGQLDYMVNTSDVPKSAVQRQLNLSQWFAFAGLVAIINCGNLSLYDVDIWAAGSAYYMTHSLILRAKEKKIAENIAKIRDENAKVNSETSESSDAQRKKRNDQVESMEQILAAQKDAINLINAKTNMLQAMVVIYGAAFAALTAMLISSEGVPTPWLCQNTKGQGMNKVELLMLQIREHIMKGFSIMNILPGLVTSAVQKATSSHELNSKMKTKYLAKINRQNEILKISMDKLKFVLSSLSSLIVASAQAQESNPKEENVYKGKLNDKKNNYEKAQREENQAKGALKNTKSQLKYDKKNRDKECFDEDTKNIESANKEYNLKKQATKTAANELADAKTALAKDTVDAGANLLGKTLYFPYVRLVLYGAAAVLTQISVSRNRKDIKVYREKISKFESDLNELKANVGKNLIEDSKDGNKTSENGAIAYGNNPGCMVTKNGNYEYDATCDCAKTNSCTSFSDKLPKDNKLDGTKELVSNVDKLMSGKIDINNEKVLDELSSKTMSTMSLLGSEVNKLRSSQDKNAKPIDFNNDAMNMIKYATGRTIANLASNTSSSVLSGSRQSKSGLGDYGAFQFGSDNKTVQSGVAKSVDLNAENKDMDLELGDVHTDADDSVFDVISIRYQKTVLPSLSKSAEINAK